MLSRIFIGFVCLCALLLSIQSNTCHAQTADETMHLAKQYFDAGNYLAAIKSYQRVNFFDPDRAYQCKERIAQSYFQLADFDQAAAYFDQAYYVQQSDSLRNEMILQKTLCLVKQRNYQASLVELLSLTEVSSAQQKYRRDLYLALAYFGVEKFDKSKTQFERLLSEDDSLRLGRLEDLFEKNEKVSKLNPDTAKWLSIFIPGAGQMYAGDWNAGINSLLLNAALLFALVNTAVTYTFWDAFISVFPWYYRYYTGGIENAEVSVKKQKQKRRARIYEEILQVLE